MTVTSSYRIHAHRADTPASLPKVLCRICHISPQPATNTVRWTGSWVYIGRVELFYMWNPPIARVPEYNAHNRRSSDLFSIIPRLCSLFAIRARTVQGKRQATQSAELNENRKCRRNSEKARQNNIHNVLIAVEDKYQANGYWWEMTVIYAYYSDVEWRRHSHSQALPDVNNICNVFNIYLIMSENRKL